MGFLAVRLKIRSWFLCLVLATTGVLSSCGCQSRINQLATAASPLPQLTAAQNLTWVETNPSYNSTVTATWALASNMTSQKIQFYSDGTCGSTSGSALTVLPAVTTASFSGADGTTYSFKVISADANGNLTTSACSSPMTLDLLACNGARLTNAPYADGDGSVATPFLICTAAQMNAIGLQTTDWNKNFKLLADISLAAYTGTQFNMIGTNTTSFSGVFDGNNHTISNLTISSTANDVGLFAYVGGASAVVKNLKMANASIDSINNAGVVAGTAKLGATISNIAILSGTITSQMTTMDMAGGVVGRLLNSTVSDVTSAITFPGSLRSSWGGGVVGYADTAAIIRASYTGTMASTNNANYCGGIAGFMSDSLIDQSYTTGTVYSVAANYVGGIVGSMGGAANITRSYFSGTVHGNAFATGGIVGSLGSDTGYGIANSYSTGAVTSSNRAGGLVGEIFTGATPSVTRSYAAGLVTGPTRGGLVGDDNGSGARQGVYTATFWDNQVNNTINAFGAGSDLAATAGVNTSTLQTPSTFSGAGWTNPPWNLTTSGVYLKLSWQP